MKLFFTKAVSFLYITGIRTTKKKRVILLNESRQVALRQKVDTHSIITGTEKTFTVLSHPLKGLTFIRFKDILNIEREHR